MANSDAAQTASPRTSERRLLERIVHWEAGGEHASFPRVDVLAHSVLNHLRRILNTRQGHVPIDPAFGVPDFTNLSGGLAKGSAGEIERQIERVIARYEPRLKSPRVGLIDSSLDIAVLHFNLDARLVLHDHEISARFLTTVNGNGKIDIQASY